MSLDTFRNTAVVFPVSGTAYVPEDHIDSRAAFGEDHETTVEALWLVLSASVVGLALLSQGAIHKLGNTANWILSL